MRAVCRGAGVARVGIDDNFFELGGDSIVSIQLVSRARRAGLSITPRAVFQHQTVAALAAAAGGGGGAGWPAAAEAAATCDRRLPATPIMRWLQERGGPLGAVQPGDAAAGAGGAAAGRIWRRRCRRCWIITMRCGCGLMRRRRTAEWRLEIAPPGAVAAAAACGGSMCGGRWR